MLAEHFNDPPSYIRSLHHLLDSYADRAKRSLQLQKPGPLIQAYKVHPPVLRLVVQELVPLAQENPEKGFALCDALWGESYLEFRLVSAMVLGHMPEDQYMEAIQRLQNWITPEMDMQLVDLILGHGLTRIRKERPDLIVKLIQHWLDDPNDYYQQLGLRALLPLIKDPDFENLPAFFRMIQPLTCHAPGFLRPDLLDVLTALAHRSPQETTYLLNHCLNLSEATDTPWLIRQILSEFPPEIQANLRQSMRKT